MEWVAWGILLTIMASLTLLLPAYWRGELIAVHDASTEGWWPFGEGSRRRFFQGLHLVVAGGLAAVIWRLLVVLRGSRNELVQSIVRVGEPICAVVFGLALVLDLSVWLFGRPRFLVPPVFRGDHAASEREPSTKAEHQRRSDAESGSHKPRLSRTKS